MAQATIYSKKGKKTGTVEIHPDIFEAKVNERLLEGVLRLYANNKRTGNAHTKVRSEVRGGGAKPWRQKGTGRARASSIRSPIWRGGGTIFGPRTRDIYNTIPKQTRKAALISALSKKYKENGIVIIDDFTLEAPKTKELNTVLENLNIAGKSMLVISAKDSENMERASRNIPKLSLKRIQDVNAYHIMRKSVLVFDKDAVKAIETRILKDVEQPEKMNKSTT